MEIKKLVGVGAEGRCHQQNVSRKSNLTTIPENLIGETAEIWCKIDNIDTLALIDTGSQITSLAFSHFNKYFSDVSLIDIGQLLKVESVSGQSLPYHGYFECSLSVPITESQSFEINVPVLVVPDTRYNQSVPLLLGTNVLNKMMNFPAKPANRFLKTAVQALALGDRHLTKSCGVYGNVVAAEDITLQPYSGVISTGKAHITVPVFQQIALVQERSDSISVVPSLVNIKQGGNSVPVEVFNESDSVVVIAKGEQIANLHQVSIEVGKKELDNEEFLNSFDYLHLNEEQTAKLKQFLLENRDVFAMNVHEMGCTSLVEHRIELEDPTPFKDKTRPIAPGMYDELRSHIAELLSAGVIEESSSPFSSNIVLVRKKDQTLRMCIDYRRLNSRSKRDSYNIPRMEALIDSLKGAKYFATLDLISGYHQVRVAEDHKERTAFSTPCGFYQMIKMPFGLHGAPSTFQRLMEKALDGLVMKVCAVYLDDIVVYSDTEEGLYHNLALVFDRLRACNLRLKPKKCCFFQPSVEYLGHSVSADGVRCSNKHIEDVSTWPEPQDIKQLQTFLGFANFHRRFVPGFSHLADPLNKLFKGHTNKRKFHGKTNAKSKSNADATPWTWGEDQQQAFQDIKSALTTPPCLAYPDFQQPFQLHVDACRTGLGAALYQRDVQGKLHPVAYGSRTLNSSERNYSAHKLEFLALKWAITVKFSYYLYGAKFPFDVYTDHNPLVYLTTTARLDALGHRWLADLAAYHFKVFYKPGVANRDADALSRRPHPEQEELKCTREVSQEVFQELCNLLTSSDFAGVAEIVNVSPTAISHAIQVMPQDCVSWPVEQDKDPVLRRVRHLVSHGIKLSERQRMREPTGVMKLLSYWKRLEIRESILYIKSQTQTGETLHRLVIPDHLQAKVLTMSHDDLGHLGRDKTLSIAQERYFWVGLTKSVEEKLKTCRRCLCAKSPHLPQRAPLVSITTSRPLELVCIDFLGLEESKGRFVNLLVITDHYTNFALAVPTRNQDAKTVAKVLMDNFIVHYGLFKRLHSDQGGSFEGKVIKHLCQLLNIAKSHTTPWHPESDGKTERFNRSLISMLRTLEPSKKSNWKDHVATLVHAYNCCKHSSTNFSPYYLMFGRSPRLAVDIFLGNPEPEGMNSTASNIRANLEVAYRIASEAANNARVRQANNYNKKVRGDTIDVGDFVLVRNVGLKGRQKLADKWKNQLHIVTKQPNPDIPVFVVRPEDGAAERVLHRNMLLPLILPWPEERNVHNDVLDDNLHVDDDSDSDVSVIEVHIPRDDVVDVHDDVDDVADVDDVVVDEIVENDLVVELEDVEVDDNASDIVTVGEAVPTGAPPQPAGDEPDQPPSVSPPSPRRSTRTTRGQPPVRLGDYVCHSQRADCVFLDWQIKVAALMQLLPLFPMYHGEILHAILFVISHA